MSDYTNPWSLTEREVQCMDALVEHGSIKSAADNLHLSERTVETHVSRAGQKMRTRTIVHKVVAWVRFRGLA